MKFSDIPLKNTGFQKKNGTRPHFKKIEKSKLNQTRHTNKISLKLLILIKKLNIYSKINQSKVKNFKQKQIKKKNKFNEATKDIQKKKINV